MPSKKPKSSKKNPRLEGIDRMKLTRKPLDEIKSHINSEQDPQLGKDEQLMDVETDESLVQEDAEDHQSDGLENGKESSTTDDVEQHQYHTLLSRASKMNTSPLRPEVPARKLYPSLSPKDLTRKVQPSDIYKPRVATQRRLPRKIPNVLEPQPRHVKPKAPHWTGYFFNGRTFSIVGLLVVVLFLFLNAFWGSTSVGREPQFNVTDVIRNLRTEFPGQPTMTFRIIQAAIKSLLRDDPEAPAIILLLAANGSEATANRFAHRLVNSLPIAQLVVIRGEDYLDEDIYGAKKNIDDSIRSGLKESQLGAVLVEDLDKIPGESALIFHSYCDHENAPYKRVVYVMTVAHKKDISLVSESKAWDSALQQHLHSSWIDAGVDQVSALLSRLTVSVAAIVAASAV